MTVSAYLAAVELGADVCFISQVDQTHQLFRASPGGDAPAA
jgi:hypothetical protein